MCRWHGLQQDGKDRCFLQAILLYPGLFSLILSTFPNTWIPVLTFALVMHFWLIFFPFLFCQAIRVLGLLGALDPYKHKVNIGMIDQSRDASAVSLSESKSSQDSCKHLEKHLFSLLFQMNTFVIYKQVFIFNLCITCLSFSSEQISMHISLSTWMLLKWYWREFNM